MQAFLDAAAVIENDAVKAWKQAGKKVVGYSCSHLPPEVFHAAGILPVRLRGIQTEGMEIGDAYFGPFICSFPKCLLQQVGMGQYAFLDGVVIIPGCDAMRRLDECWRKAGNDHKHIVPGWFDYLDVPHKSEGHGLRWYQTELQHLLTRIEQYFGVTVTADALRESIDTYNRGRQLLQSLLEFRKRDNTVVSGSDVFAATVAATVLPREDFNRQLENWLAELANKDPLASNTKRLMVVGSISDEIDLFQLIESESQAVVVAENLCFGVRHAGGQVATSGDPIAALAKHYLATSICPRMFGKYKERLALLKQIIDRYQVQGLVLQNIRFCDLHGSENGLFERDLEAIGIPCLRIEREYGLLTETGRIKLRIDAFLENLD